MFERALSAAATCRQQRRSLFEFLTELLTARLRGKQPKLSPRQEAHIVTLRNAGTHTSAELAELFSVARSTVYRAIQRAG